MKVSTVPWGLNDQISWFYWHPELLLTFRGGTSPGRDRNVMSYWKFAQSPERLMPRLPIPGIVSSSSANNSFSRL